MQDAVSVGLQPRIFHNHVFIRQTSTETQCAAGNGSDLWVAREMPLPSSSHSILPGPCFCPPQCYYSAPAPGRRELPMWCEGPKPHPSLGVPVTLAQGSPNSRGPRNVCGMSWGGQGPPCHREWVKEVWEQLRCRSVPEGGA